MSYHSDFKLLTVDQFALLLNASRTTIFHLIKTGELQEGVHYIRFGRILRFRWLEEILFCKPPQRTKQPVKKRPTSSRKVSPSSEAAVNLDYGVVTA